MSNSTSTTRAMANANMRFRGSFSPTARFTYAARKALPISLRVSRWLAIRELTIEKTKNRVDCTRALILTLANILGDIKSNGNARQFKYVRVENILHLGRLYVRKLDKVRETVECRDDGLKIFKLAAIKRGEYTN